MRKNILIVGIILMLIASLFVLTGCEKNKEIVLKDNKTGYTTTFKYPESQNFNIVDEDQESGTFVEMTIENQEKNIELEMYYFEESDSSYELSKEGRKDADGYKEYKWNNYEGYIYSVDNNSLYFNVLLHKETSEDDMDIGLFGSLTSINYDESNVPETFDSKDFQDFMNSMEFKIEK